MITYRFTNAAGVDIEVLTDGLGDAVNELHVVEIRGVDTAAIKGGFKFDIYPYNEVEFEIFAAAHNLTLSKYENNTEVEGSPLTEEGENYSVPYVEEDSVTSIDPATVTFAKDEFTVPSGVVAFTFVDGNKDYDVTFDGWSWNFEWEGLPFTVAYTAEMVVDDIVPDSVTYADGEFTVPYGTTEFTFKDNDKTFSATLNEGTWSIDEVVAP